MIVVRELQSFINNGIEQLDGDRYDFGIRHIESIHTQMNQI